MPELPDVEAYLDALTSRILHQRLQRVTIAAPFLLRTADPLLSETFGRAVTAVRRIGKRIAIGLDGDYWLVVHLMIAGRLQWKAPGATLAGRNQLASFAFPNGTLVLTEAGSKHRAALFVLRGIDALEAVDPGGADPLSIDFPAFRATLAAENHTLKRVLTDPHLLSGIGNAYSDEILFEAGLSPLALTKKLSDGEWRRLYDAMQRVLCEWSERLRSEAKHDFPKRVTAFRPDMKVHGKFGEPCVACGEPIRRIRYAENETNYCARCQTGGKVLADRALSRLLK